MVRVSIITLTCNRREKLERGLARLAPQLNDDDEIIVVDTGSEDGTREALAESPWPQVCLATFDREGSWAEMRNCGVRAAYGDAIAFLDDDCLADEDWVARGRAAIAEADAVGGLVRAIGIPHWPHWWDPEMGWLAGLCVPGHLGPDAGRVHYPSTSNLWVRRLVALAEPFQEIGGRLGGDERERYATGREDAEWWRRLRVKGYRTRFDPGLAAGHAIDPKRLNLKYLRRRAELDGEAWALREGGTDDIRPTAYQWWTNWAAEQAWREEEEECQPGHVHYHRLVRRRQSKALQGLIAKTQGKTGAAARVAWMRAWAEAGLDFARNRAKTIVRKATAPWWRSKPQSRGHRPPKRLAVVCSAFVGDMLMVQGVLRGLNTARPKMEMHVLAPAHAAPTLRGLPGVTAHVLPENLDPRDKASFQIAKLWLEQWLAERKPHAIVAPYLHEPWGPVLTAIRRPPCPMYGFDQDSGLRRQRELLRLTQRVEKRMDRHELENLAALFGAAGVPCRPEPPQVYPGIEGQRVVQTALENDEAGLLRGRPWVMLNPFAGDAQKHWDDAHWETVARWLIQSTDAAVIVNAHQAGGPWAALAEEHPGRVLALAGVSLDTLIAWIARVRLLVTVDAGPQHLAQALGTPALVLFGPGDERRWGDFWGEDSGWRGRAPYRALRGCAPDLTPEERRGVPINQQTLCITPERVMVEIRKLLPARTSVEDLV